MLVLIGTAQAQETLIPTGATWKFRKGTNEVSVPTTQWLSRTYAATAWALGSAPFHYGEGLTGGTSLSDMRGNYTCVFLRREFVLTNVAEIQALTLAVNYDDGFMAWINGAEVASSGAPGQLAYTNVATQAHEAGSLVTFTPSVAPASFLVIGTNVLAVQAFNNSLSGSSDFRFDATLMVTRSDASPPEVASHEPLGPEVNALSQITVVFTEPVLGVRAGDLLVNDQPAAVVSAGTGTNRYTFSFTSPSPGAVTIAWNEAQRIVDLLGNPFNSEATTATWSYNLNDTVGPVLRERAPVAGAFVSQLTRMEVLFSEPVTGVDTSDLLINGQPALLVSGQEAGPYQFEFAQPAPGTVQASWKPGHEIRDLAPSANLFAGGNWVLTLNPGAQPGGVRINEIMASNATGLTDEDGEPQDWIELFNAGSIAVNLLGWSLSDDPDAPAKWTFPDRVLNPGAYLVVFASGKDRRAPAGANRYHTNFRLNAFGEFLALFNAEYPRVAVSAFDPYPEQRINYAYGLDATNAWRYFATYTPGGANASSALTGMAPPPHVTIGRGMFDQPFDVRLTTPLTGASIRYTTDGSDPALGAGAVYSGPIRIASTTTLRAAVLAPGLLPSRTRTETYVFLDQVIEQSAAQAGRPPTWGSWSGFPNSLVPADYAMDLDPLRVDPANPASAVDPARRQRLQNGLRQLPLVSVVMPPGDLFGTGGLYPSASDANKAPNEKACSIEMLLPDGATAFAVHAGLDLHGNASRSPLKNPKHGFKLKFKGDYGETELNYRLFPDSPVERFDDLILRPDFNSSWRHWSDVAGNGNGAFQRSRGTRTRYAWSQETFRDLGHVGSHTRFCHLFLNGLYWGVYDFGEQPTATFAQNYYGGEAVTHDIYDQGAMRNGTSAAYAAMQAITDLANRENYERMRQLLDIPEFIDYTLLHFYVGHQDWGANKNWYALRPRVAGAAGTFKYLPWDQECILLEETVNRVPNGGGSTDVPSGLHTKLDDNAEYRLEFADRVFKHLLAPGGALTAEANIARWLKWQALLDEPIVSESCRWGDYRRDVHRYADGAYQLYTREAHWLAENDRLVNAYFRNRGSIVLGQLKTAGLYPIVDSPSLNQQGERVPAGFQLIATAPAGTTYYTTNGADPRLYGSGGIASHAVAYGGPITLTRSVVFKARVLHNGVWSALNEASFAVGELGTPVRFTEIHYNPPGGDAFEFLELQHVGAVPLDLAGASLEGIDYVFPAGTVLAPGARIVLSSDADPGAFQVRYPSTIVFGTFGGSLDNGGERLAVVDRHGRTLVAVHYNDRNGWPLEADGGGYSLEVVDPSDDPNAPANWRIGTAPFGTPGLPATVPAASPIALNEVMAENLTAVEHAGGFPDWIELINRGLSAVDLAGWSLTDDGDPRKFVVPPGTVLPPGEFLVIWCDDITGPGLHAGFFLGRKGETVQLFDRETNRVDAVSFGCQLPDLTLGRVGVDWQLTVPTPNLSNEARPVASATHLVLNEWLANPGPGGDDWVELHNRSATAPVALRGIHVGTDDAPARLGSHAFVGPGGYVQLLADEATGPDHLELKLPASGTTLILYDPTGQELDRLSYGPQLENVTAGRWPNGTGAVASFPGRASPGAANERSANSATGLNEILARNQQATLAPWGRYADWIELHNPSLNTSDLAGMGLRLESESSASWTFPAGARLGPGEYLVIWCDGERAATSGPGGPFNTGFSLPGNSGEVTLLDVAGLPVDAVVFGFQIANLPIGKRAGTWQLLAAPSPGEANGPAAELGLTSALRVNEWMAAPTTGTDWFELFNTGFLPVDLGGLFLTDHPSVQGWTNTPVAPFSFIDARSHVRWWADEQPAEGRDHARFRLDDLGETLRLYAADGALIDAVEFGVQTVGWSQGRWPDGSGTLAGFVESASPGDANYLALPGMVIHEVLTHTDPPFEDAIELHNTTATSVDVSGWFLSDRADDLKRYRIADGTVLPPGGYLVVYQQQFGTADGEGDAPPRFSLSSARGETVFLAEADGAGNLTGRRTHVTFGAAANGVSFGRYVTSVGVEFVAQRGRSFGADAATTLAEFRGGHGLPNLGPAIGPVVLSELMVQPAATSGGAGSDRNFEFIEIHNRSAEAIDLFDPAHPTNGWRLANAVTFEFAQGTRLAAGATLVVVAFDPIADPASAAAFRATFGGAPVLAGPFAGRLDNGGERVDLLRPDAPQTLPHPDAGLVPYLLVDHMDYATQPPWPTNVLGTGLSLQRRSLDDYGNDPVNWIAGAPTPGGEAGDVDRDGDGMPDAWESAWDTDPDRADAGEDPDEDGLTNLQEFGAGTNPRSASSTLRLQLVAVGMAEVRFTFQSQARRSYRVLYRDVLGAGTWVPLVEIPAVESEGTVTVLDPAPSPTARYYRLVTPGLPAIP